MKQIRVLFTGKQLRQRRKETVLNPPENIEFITQKSLEKMSSDHQLIKEKEKRKRKLLKSIVGLFNIPNIRHIPKNSLKNINLVYTTGQIIINQFPYVIEVDNAGCLGFYSYKTINNIVGKLIIKFFLKSKNCKKIVCISEAAKKSMTNTFKSEKITEKCEVVYPYVKLNEKIKKNKDRIRFLCCNRKFYQKGTLNVLQSFVDLKKDYNNIELWVISNTPKEIKKRYNSPGITFFEAKYTKPELYELFYSKADVFVQPTMQDSFGLVYFEVMANKMAVITTNLFAIPEFVQDGRNGIIIKSPFYMFNKDCTLKKEYFPRRSNLYKQYNYDGLFTNNIKNAMKKMLDDPARMREMQEESLKILNAEPFSESIRTKKLKRIFQQATH